MNDTERELRALFESKAGEVGSPAPASREVLRRGRRRQAGTIAVAGITTLAVAAAALVSVQALRRADTARVPGQSPNPSFTATIQNFSITTPAGWTLIDQWPLVADNMLGSSSASFSCVGQPIRAGSATRNSPGPIPDCTESPLPTSAPSTDRPIGLPILQISNFDPGLDGTLCDSGPLPADGVAMFVAIDPLIFDDAAQTDALPWPTHMVNVTEDPGGGSSWPCGVGGYAWFQVAGVPYYAWGGFGSDFTDADRDAMIDAFHGMRVDDGSLQGPLDETPGYVLTGGVRADGSAWSIEARPTDVNVDLSYREVDGRSGGVADFRVPDVPIEAGHAKGLIYGAVSVEAERVELRPSNGSPAVAGTILQLPSSLRAPFDAFIVMSDEEGTVVAVGPNGDLSAPRATGGPTDAPSGPSLKEAQADLRNALAAALTYHVHAHAYDGFDPAAASAIEPSLTWGTSPSGTTTPGVVDIRLADRHSLILVTAAGDGQVYCIAQDEALGTTGYGVIDTGNPQECSGTPAIWDGTGGFPTDYPPKISEDEYGFQIFAFGRSATIRVYPDGGDVCEDFDGLGVTTCSSGGISSFRPSLEIAKVEAGDGAWLYGTVPASVEVVSVTAGGVNWSGNPAALGSAAASQFGDIKLVLIPLNGIRRGGEVRFTDAEGNSLFRSLSFSWPIQGIAIEEHLPS